MSACLENLIHVDRVLNLQILVVWRLALKRSDGIVRSRAQAGRVAVAELEGKSGEQGDQRKHNQQSGEIGEHKNHEFQDSEQTALPIDLPQ